MKRGKKYQEAVKKLDREKLYSVADAAKLVKEIAFAKIFGKTGIKINMSVMFDVMSPDEWGEALGIADKTKLNGIAKKYAGMQFYKKKSDIPDELVDSAVKTTIEGVNDLIFEL